MRISLLFVLVFGGLATNAFANDEGFRFRLLPGLAIAKIVSNEPQNLSNQDERDDLRVTPSVQIGGEYIRRKLIISSALSYIQLGIGDRNEPNIKLNYIALPLLAGIETKVNHKLALEIQGGITPAVQVNCRLKSVAYINNQKIDEWTNNCQSQEIPEFESVTRYDFMGTASLGLRFLTKSKVTVLFIGSFFHGLVDIFDLAAGLSDYRYLNRAGSLSLGISWGLTNSNTAN